jgi:ribosomal protein L11 methylase PrmA
MIKEKASFRDDAGFVFYQGQNVFRVITDKYAEEYSHLMSSGLYEQLVKKGFLISHSEEENTQGEPFHKILKVKKLPFVSYPYEWSFGQLKDAAILSLEIQKEALLHNMVLKDASAYNVQFEGCKPLFIDTLSFDKYNEGQPWQAYRQFCQHFLNPLMLIKYSGESFAKLSVNYIDGIPVTIASSLLSSRAYLNFTALINIFFHSRLEQKVLKGKETGKASSEVNISKERLLKINDFLLDGIKNLNNASSKSAWSDYVDDNNYIDNALEYKKEIVGNWTSRVKPEMTWDVGCNTGLFSEIAAQHSKYVLALDYDYQSVNFLYEKVKAKDIRNIHPLCVDILNPTPAIGWGNEERKSFLERSNPDLIIALAVIHHLRITGGIPVEKIAELLNQKCQYLIIEFVEKSDSQIKRMLSSRKDIFDDYHTESFKQIFSQYFNIIEEQAIPDSHRCLYLMQKIS